MDDGQRDLALAQVAGHRLAQYVFGGGQVEDIIGDLKGHSQTAAVFRQTLFLLSRHSAQNSSEAHAHRKQAGGLAVDELQMLVQRDAAAELLNLQQFAFHHALGQVNEHVEDSEVPLLDGQLESLHVEPVAGQHAA